MTLLGTIKSDASISLYSKPQGRLTLVSGTSVSYSAFGYDVATIIGKGGGVDGPADTCIVMINQMDETDLQSVLDSAVTAVNGV